MRRILLTICLFISIVLKAQQVFIYSGIDECETPMPIDTAWCRANSIDKITCNIIAHNKDRKRKLWGGAVAYYINNGVPYKAVSLQWPFDTVYTVIANAELYYDLRGDTTAIADTIEHSYKKKSHYKNDNFESSGYTKNYHFADGKIKNVVYASAVINDGYFGYNGGVYNYYYNGNLISKITDTPANQDSTYLRTEFSYIRGNLQYVYHDLDVGDEYGTVAETYITYYSKNKKVKLK